MLRVASPPTETEAPAERVTWAMALPYPLRTLLHRWRGTIGMMLGVGIALSMTMTMLAVSRAGFDFYIADFVQSGADLYVVTEGGSLLPVLPGDSPGTIKHARRVLAQVRGLPHVNGAIGVITWPMERQREGPRRADAPAELLSVMGVEGDPTAIPNALVVKEGRWPRRSDEIFLGSKLSRDKALGLGATLRLNGRDFTVVGTGKLRAFGFTTDSLAYLDYAAFRDRAEIGDVVNVIAIDTARPDDVRRRLAEIDSLKTTDPAELVKQAEAINGPSLAFYWIVGLLALAISALFVSNMLSRSVIERRLEFATLKAIGIPSRTILLVVAAEAVLISLVASLIGIGLSLVFGWLINVYIAQPFGIDSFYTVDAGSFGFVFVLALALGLGAGLLPARRATRVDPVEILREA